MINKQLIALMYGWIVALGLVLVASIILALFLRFTSFNEPILSWVTLGVGLTALFLGGLVAGIKGKKKGWVIGGAIGIGFSLFIFLVQYLGYKQGFSMEQMIHHFGYIIAALIGGVFGVNTIVTEKE